MSGTRPLSFYIKGLVEGLTGRVVQQKRDRTVWEVDEKGAHYFAKRGSGPKRAEIRQEAANARALAAAGLGAIVAASGPDGGAEWLVTDFAGDPFSRALEREEPSRARLGELAGLIRTLHQQGHSFPDLTDHHVRATKGGALRIIDAARLETGRAPAPLRDRARDLAALLFSWGPPRLWSGPSAVSVSERVRLVRDGTGLRGPELRKLLALIESEVQALAARTRWRHEYHVATPVLLDAIRTPSDDPSVTPFALLFDRKRSVVVRTLADRENRRLGRGKRGRPLYYAKVFPPTSRGFSPAMNEVAAIDLFLRSGIPVNRVAAYAEDVELGSMIAVEACAGEPLDDLLRGGVSNAERRELAVATARIWCRMRECGLRHRDAYPCHVFAARTSAPGHFELRLIDFTRAGRAPWPKERWYVKDAAQLWHGARAAGATSTDAVRWLREYFRVPSLSRKAKRFARAVAAKERSIAAHVARKARRVP